MGTEGARTCKLFGHQGKFSIKRILSRLTTPLFGGRYLVGHSKCTLLNHYFKTQPQIVICYIKNAARGDNANAPREVALLLCAPTQEKAELVANFIMDNSYGVASVQYSEHSESEEQWGILVKIVTPTTEHVICCISGLMECIAKLFQIKFDGWESELQSAQPSAQTDRA